MTMDYVVGWVLHFLKEKKALNWMDQNAVDIADERVD